MIYKDYETRLRAIEGRFSNFLYNTAAVVQSTLNDGVKVLVQEETLNGIYLAFCIDTIDIWKMNRIRFFCPFIHSPYRPIKEFPWAYPISSMGGFDDCGLNWVPPAGSTVAIMFENGDRNSPYYLGTVWHRNRGPEGKHNWLYSSMGGPKSEYKEVYEGKRKGYLVGANDESQVLPPWNTESYNGFDLNSIVDFSSDPEAQKRITYPNIYGFKTPEKHMLKMVDGDAKCNRKWKRMELMSSCGNWMMFKDDHLHYCGQWAHTSCGAKPGDVSCVQGQDEGSPEDDTTKQYGLISRYQSLTGEGIDTEAIFGTVAGRVNDANTRNTSARSYVPKEKTDCDGKTSNKKIIGGHPSTGSPNSKYPDSQVGDNPYFKHENECRPYKGPSTPQNNKCDLPQTGIQFMSISGHTFVMDDSVEEPSGDMGWSRSTKAFDFGCNNTFAGRMYLKSATGHSIEISDLETSGKTPVRSENNYIMLKTATGNKVELNDHTIAPCTAGSRRGVHIQSTSNHTLDMCDEANEQCSETRKEGASPKATAKKAYIKMRTGYGLEIMMNDSSSQEETQQQYIQLLAPQKTKPGSCGPHIIRMQESTNSENSYIFLRSGGRYVISTCKDKVEIIGDPEKNPSDCVEIISRLKVVSTEDYYVNVTKKSHVFVANEKILLLAGKDCQPKNNDDGCVPCLGPVVVYVGGCLRLSDRVYASASCTAQGASIFMLEPLVQCPTDPCCTSSAGTPADKAADESTLRAKQAITSGEASENQASGV
jgi:hypothetical protein